MLPGAYIEFVSDPIRPIVSYGHIVPNMDLDGSGFRVVALTENADISLQASYYGLARPSVFRPDWVDSVSSSSLLVALLALLSLLSVAIEVVARFIAAGTAVSEDSKFGEN